MTTKSIIVLIALTLLSQILIAQEVYSETGIASYYADRFDGRKTANGEVFRNSKMTAAHKKLAFGTVLIVTNLKNGKTVEVRVNDRGPYAHGRIIDLSKAAARKIGMLEDGLADVRIESKPEEIRTMKPAIKKEVSTKTVPSGSVISIYGTEREVSGYGVQIASFENRESAISYGKELYNNGIELPLIKVHRQNGKIFYRVMAGVFENQAGAEKYRKRMKNKGYKGFVKTYE